MECKELARRFRSVVSLYARQKALDFLWDSNGCNWVWKVFKGCRVLAYHTVAPKEGLFDQGEKLSISPENFEQHLLFFKKHFDVVSLEELMLRQAQGESADHCLAITFDDGYQSLFEYGVPLLEAHKIPCTVFLSTAFLDNQAVSWPLKVNYLKNIGASDVYKKCLCAEMKIPVETVGDNIVAHAVNCFSPERIIRVISRGFKEAGIDESVVCKEASLYVSSDTVKNMNSKVVAFGNHTHTHPVMRALTLDEQRTEIEASHRILRKDLGLRGFLPFAFPFGRPGADFTQESVRILSDFGYSCICAASFNKFRRGKRMGCVNRIPMPVGFFNEKQVFGRLCRIR